MHSLESVIEDIRKNKVFTFDFEAKSTTDNPKDAKSPWTAEPTLLALSGASRYGAFEITDELVELFRDLMSTEGLIGIAHNINYDCLLAHLYDLMDINQIGPTIIDTLVISWLLNEEEEHGLKALTLKYLRHKMMTYEEASSTSPYMRGISACESALDDMDDSLQNWAKRRPFPTFKDRPLSIYKIRKHYREVEGLKKEDIKTRIKELFSTEAYMEYEEFVQQWKPTIKRKLKDLEIKAAVQFKDYAADDAWQTMRLYKKLLPKLQKAGLTAWFEIESSVRLETVKMEINGIGMDVNHLQRAGEEIKPLIEEFEAEIFGHIREEINIASNPKLHKAIYSTLQINPPEFERVWDDSLGRHRLLPKLSAAGKEYIKQHKVKLDLNDPDTIPDAMREKGFSTDSLTLSMVAHPVAQAVLNWRTVDKLRSTYVQKLIDLVNTRTGDPSKVGGGHRLHAGFNSVGAKTGRFSSSNPNLQNIPSRAKSSEYDERIQDIGPSLRKAFTPPDPDEKAPEGYALLVSDQSQVELRIITHFCEDYTLQEIYTRGIVIDGIKHYTGDIHAETSNKLGIPRKAAKGVNFGFNYGMGPPKFARQIRLVKEGTYEYDIETAKEYRLGFFSSYPRLQEYIRFLRHGIESGNLEFSMVSGRKRHFTHPNYTGGTVLNSKVQGSSADFIKANIYIMAKYVLPKYPGTYLALQVHDELIYVAPKRFAEEVGTLLKYVMEYSWFSISVPILATTKICYNNWAEAGDDGIPEIGNLYVRVSGEDRLYNKDNWDEFLNLDPKSIEQRGAANRLTQKEIEWCKTIIPDKGPLIQAQRTGRILSRQEELAIRAQA